ncbi:AraC family transcriptional regulator [Anatilimnocola floriformis]|uniref:AraC family transcriptional regulator n=1 Tax=Anatilimnocola floriformis TaxID=2948575 RepID=UPI0020C1FA5E|nr:AraC family transcriptional regulator [Anatilimnocola floriformis]
MESPADQREARRAADNLSELAELIDSTILCDGVREVRPGVFLRRTTQAGERVQGVCDPGLCVVAQGSKIITLGDESFLQKRAEYLITTMALPFVGEVVDVSPEHPYLSFRIALDSALVTSVMVESGFINPRTEGSAKAVDVSPLDHKLLDATVRLMRLVNSPNEYRVLAPLVTREIIYRLLTGAQGNRLRHLATLGGQSHRMVRALELIRENFDKPLKIEEIARELCMSVSSFHAHFKAVTALSPLQYQKQLRLEEARRLMLTEKLDAAQAGYRVGYEDASHFSRDYKRSFGEPPIRHVEQLREITGLRATS